MAKSADGQIKILGGVPSRSTRRLAGTEASMERLDERLRHIRRESAKIAQRSTGRSR
jgi:hypothetical protein